MERLFEIEFAGAFNHEASRRDQQEEVFLTDQDQQGIVTLIAEITNLFNWWYNACCNWNVI